MGHDIFKPTRIFSHPCEFLIPQRDEGAPPFAPAAENQRHRSPVHVTVRQEDQLHYLVPEVVWQADERCHLVEEVVELVEDHDVCVALSQVVQDLFQQPGEVFGLASVLLVKAHPVALKLPLQVLHPVRLHAGAVERTAAVGDDPHLRGLPQVGVVRRGLEGKTWFSPVRSRTTKQEGQEFLGTGLAFLLEVPLTGEGGPHRPYELRDGSVDRELLRHPGSAPGQLPCRRDELEVGRSAGRPGHDEGQLLQQAVPLTDGLCVGDDWRPWCLPA